MKKIILVLSIVFLAVSMNANSGDNDKTAVKTTQVKGKVVDVVTGESLAGVQVKISGTNQVVYTDFDGNFVIQNIQPGKYNIETSYISYQSNTLREVNLTSIDNNTVKVEMQVVSTK
ncbi:MAG: hypothetical protein A2W91_06920 [Bacteroidetes bacterium GWF2_38_335]|nr:MAG: hypothetical protein A2W91_06920 [Bacteroidetes bacterium GWF2_38_335]OFY80893.1 MAG: hypothetical protein A2281_04785 [Bacteroidetes bacterium RIFOXYA12_FULL_38_20]HBS84949.1 hypothetical protein [Bacteroidales bacterium]